MPDSDAPFDAPREVTRSVEFRADADGGDGLTLDGVAAVFNEWTTIDSWEGQFKERIAPGAFKKTLRERTPVLQFDHGQHPMIGSMPIGAITSLKETPDGLRVGARLADNWMIQPIRDAISNGSISGMSIRFRVIGDKWTKPKEGLPERTITEIGLVELGPVVFPAYPTTSVGVRSADPLTAAIDARIAEHAARLATPGTAEEAAAVTDAPGEAHATTRTRSQRRAAVLLRSIKESA